MKLSIITINYNNKEGLTRTVESVKCQRCKDFEYIVVDGDSTDGSKDIMQEYADVINIAISEKDTGIYDAMNKGTRAAHGDFLLFLNSGDWLNSTDVTEVILPHLNDEIDILNGYVLLDGSFKRYLPGSPQHLTISTILHSALSHQSTFIRRSFLINRPYHEDYRIISDWIFFLETSIYDSPRYQHIDFDVAVFESAGLSSNAEGLAKEHKAFGSTFLSAHAVRDIYYMPPDLFVMFRQIPYSFKFLKYCVRVIRWMFNIYTFIRPKSIHKCDKPCIKKSDLNLIKSEKIRFSNSQK